MGYRRWNDGFRRSWGPPYRLSPIAYRLSPIAYRYRRLSTISTSPIYGRNASGTAIDPSARW